MAATLRCCNRRGAVSPESDDPAGGNLLFLSHGYLGAVVRRRASRGEQGRRRAPVARPRRRGRARRDQGRFGSAGRDLRRCRAGLRGARLFVAPSVPRAIARGRNSGSRSMPRAYPGVLPVQKVDAKLIAQDVEQELARGGVQALVGRMERRAVEDRPERSAACGCWSGFENPVTHEPGCGLRIP